MEYKIKWALGSAAANKVSGDDGILAELFKILKDDAVNKCCTQYVSKFGILKDDAVNKCCTQYVSKFGKPSSGWKRSVLIPIPKKGSTKNVQTTRQLHSSPMLVR